MKRWGYYVVIACASTSKCRQRESRGVSFAPTDRDGNLKTLKNMGYQ